jgi:hypothetical protein
MRSVRREGWAIGKVGRNFSREVTEEYVRVVTRLFCNIHVPIDDIESTFEVNGNRM